MKEYFTISEHTLVDKSFFIDGPNISLEVDYDDVDNNTVDITIEKIVKILNDNWKEI